LTIARGFNRGYGLRYTAPFPGVETPGYFREVPAGTAKRVPPRKSFWTRGSLEI
jgi:hypothetical protein